MPEERAALPDDGADGPDRERAGIQSVEVGFSLLEVLAQAAGPLMLRDLAANAGMSAAKAHRYLVSFQRLGLVLQDPRTTRYDLGPAALRLGLAALSRLDAVRLARERVGDLMERVGHTLALAVWGNHGPTIVHWEESPLAEPVNLRLGDVMPLLTSATGRCFAAFLSHGSAHGRIGPMLETELARARQLGRTDVPTDAAGLQAMLAEVRRHGIGRVVSVLLPGISGLCAPVFDASGHLALGILSMGSGANFDADWDGAIARPLRAAAQRLSRDLGYTGP
jgi:DNA-binding IclR family transcriptional regulator